MKSVVTISRKWDNPKINTWVTGEEIGIKMDMADFVTALKQELGSVTWTFKKDTFDKQLDAAILNVIQGMKDETIKVV
jgi:hypothetical protein